MNRSGCSKFLFLSDVLMEILINLSIFKDKGYGSEFLTLIEKWLKSEGYKIIHTESSPGAVNFYKKHGYELMDFNCPSGDTTDPRDTAMGKIL